MLRIPRLMLLTLILLVFCHHQTTHQIIFYVSPVGNDSWTGTLKEPNDDHSDGPFATFSRAIAAIQEAQQTNTAARRVVMIRAGQYLLSEPIYLNGINNCLWRAYHDEHVALIGAQRISQFEPIGDETILSRIAPELRDKILKCDLKAVGIENYGEISQRGRPGLELFFNGKRMTLARYPNDAWLHIADVPQFGEKLLNEGLEREKRYDGVPVGRHYGRIKYDGERPSRWSTQNQIYLHGYWTWDWNDSYQKVQSIDLDRREITLAEPHHNYGYTKNQRYYFLNILEELDRPGEWVLDRERGWLFFYPPMPIDQGEAFVSLLDQPLMVLENCHNVSIQSLHLEMSRGSGVVIDKGSNNLIAGCTFRNLGDYAVLINGGTHNGITSCDLYDLALGGIVLRGGNQMDLTPGNNFAINNHIHDWSTYVRTYQVAVELHGVGNRVAHNLMHDAPHSAIFTRGSEHLIEFNEIFNVCNETGDAGAIYTGRNYAWRGNIWRYNYIHHLKGPGLHGCTALYLDDFASAHTLYGNICYKSGRGVLLGGGRDNLVENNIFISCAPSIVQDARGLSWATNYFDGTYPVLKDSLEAVNFREPPYSEKYPELLTLYDDEPAVPKNNKILRNISCCGRFIERYDYFAYDPSVVTIKENVIADSIIYKRIKEPPAGWEPYYLNLDTEANYRYFKRDQADQVGDLQGNLIINSDPGFKNIKQADFRLKPSSPAFKLGFKEIPIEKIGLFRDEYRRELHKRLDSYSRRNKQ
ncbi:MAG: right-handed parallel beta-helix repeat-containing protein [candidate division KSB1 bacterium]|nr:right-handed parallel beta-helix repeat-containing protein [candidate division KSB1 bacterium]MDZ7356069.1 right-handed parallel beta-helix repeat-containing protein [candidate division KSB1 bacterium]